MRHLLPVSLAMLTCASISHAQPVIRANSIMNPASRLSARIPNYVMRQATLFIVRGAGLASGMPSSPSAGSPLPMTLAGASMQITAGGSTINVPMVYAARNMQDYRGNYDELAGIAPSSTPAGSGM